MTSNDPPQANSETKACRAMEYLNSAVMFFDADLRLQYINPAGEMLLALSSRQSLGHTVAELLPDNQEVLVAFHQSLEQGRPFSEREMRLILPGKHYVTVWCMATPIQALQPGHEFLVEMIPIDRQLRIIREGVLIAQNKATKALVRGLAHEIKNPLGGLRGAAQLLEQELAGESLKEYTRIIIEEADRLKNLLNRMLGPSNLPDKRSHNIHEALERVRSLAAAEAPAGVLIRSDYDPSIPPVDVDREQLIQALLNLIRNALQSIGSDPGLIRLRTRIVRQCTIGAESHRLVARIDIIDNGPGIPDELKENIFLPMVTSKSDGEGLGLPIAQSLVQQNGGVIECDSRPGKTKFSLYLPLPSGLET